MVGAAAGLLLAVSASTARGDDTPNQARDALVRDQKNLMTVLGAFALGSMATGVPLLTSNRAEVRAVGPAWPRLRFLRPTTHGSMEPSAPFFESRT